jgi:hypothetical protein
MRRNVVAHGSAPAGRLGPAWRVVLAGSGAFCILPSLVPPAMGTPPAVDPADPPGRAIYREHCAHCHGEGGRGTADLPEPLEGDRSVAQLAAYIDQTMPDGEPEAVVGDDARAVAEYIHGSFYSAIARDRNRPARPEVARLTARQYLQTLTDLVGSFSGTPPRPVHGAIPPGGEARGLKGEYFNARSFDAKEKLGERIDSEVAFDFGVEGPDPERFDPRRFAVRWTGSITAAETGIYEFIVRTEHAFRLSVNGEWFDPPLIDAWVKSGSDTVFRAPLWLIGGRAYPLRLEFSKATQGVDSTKNEYATPASIRLEWKPPRGAVEVVPARVLSPAAGAATFVIDAAFPPDDRSIGYERGSQVSREWFEAATAAATQAADRIVERVEHLARVKRDAPDRRAKLEAFAASFAERAFRRPLSDDVKERYVRRPFAESPDDDTGLKRSLLAVLGSPRFLYRTPPGPGLPFDDFAVADALAIGLWDSLPDRPALEAAARGQLHEPAQIRRQAERMIFDPRTRAKLRDFLFDWLRVADPPEIVKDASLGVAFTPAIAADLRTSLELQIADVLDREPHDLRRLFTADTVPLNARLAPLFGVAVAPASGFRPVRIDEGRRAGVLTHPYLMSLLSYGGTTSPIHRGVFLARGILGNVLKPPQEAVTPLAPDLHPDLSTRERVALQTSPVGCATCHSMINPLGFALEEFDAIGRYRTVERRGEMQKPVDASGAYQPRQGVAVRFTGGRALAAYVAESRDAHEAFVQDLFHALVKQPVRAWGPESLAELVGEFESSGCDIRRLVLAIMEMAVEPPLALARDG